MRPTTWISAFGLAALAGVIGLARRGPTEISSLPFTIEAPGSYVVTADLLGPAGVDGITLTVGGVRIDLDGHTLEGSEGSGGGVVALGALEGVELRGGEVRLFGGDGVDLAQCTGVRLTELRAMDNGGHGVAVGDDARLVDCAADLNHGGRGFVLGDGGELMRCTAFQNEYGGIHAGDGATLVDCEARRCVYGGGLRLGARAVVRGGRALENDDAGLVVGAGSLVSGFEADRNLSVGIEAGPDSLLVDCTAQRTRDGHGITIARGGLARGCRSGLNQASGLVAAQGAELVRCLARANRRHGLVAGGGSTVLGARADGNAGDGLRITGEGATLVDNRLRRNGAADLRVEGRGHLVFRNHATRGKVHVADGSTVGPWLPPAEAAASAGANVVEPASRGVGGSGEDG